METIGFLCILELFLEVEADLFGMNTTVFGLEL